jgi:ketosteroid isomerase-like protein
LDEVREREDRVAVAFSWNASDGSRTRWAQLLKLQNGRIVSMRDYASPKRALRAAGA